MKRVLTRLLAAVLVGTIAFTAACSGAQEG